MTAQRLPPVRAASHFVSALAILLAGAALFLMPNLGSTATVIGNIQDVSFNAYGGTVNLMQFTPLSCPQQIGTNTVWPVQSKIRLTNGLFQIQLAGGLYYAGLIGDVAVGQTPKTVKILVPPNDTNIWQFNACASLATNLPIFTWTNGFYNLLAGTNILFTTNGAFIVINSTATGGGSGGSTNGLAGTNYVWSSINSFATTGTVYHAQNADNATLASAVMSYTGNVNWGQVTGQLTSLTVSNLTAVPLTVNGGNSGTKPHIQNWYSGTNLASYIDWSGLFTGTAWKAQGLYSSDGVLGLQYLFNDPGYGWTGDLNGLLNALLASGGGNGANLTNVPYSSLANAPDVVTNKQPTVFVGFGNNYGAIQFSTYQDVSPTIFVDPVSHNTWNSGLVINDLLFGFVNSGGNPPYIRFSITNSGPQSIIYSDLFSGSGSLLKDIPTASIIGGASTNYVNAATNRLISTNLTVTTLNGLTNSVTWVGNAPTITIGETPEAGFTNGTANNTTQTNVTLYGSTAFGGLNIGSTNTGSVVLWTNIQNTGAEADLIVGSPAAGTNMVLQAFPSGNVSLTQSNALLTTGRLNVSSNISLTGGGSSLNGMTVTGGVVKASSAIYGTWTVGAYSSAGYISGTVLQGINNSDYSIFVGAPTYDTAPKNLFLSPASAYASATVNKNGGYVYIRGGTPATGGSYGPIVLGDNGSSVICGNTLTATNGIWLPTNSPCPAPQSWGGLLWNSNNALYWVTTTHTNLLSAP